MLRRMMSKSLLVFSMTAVLLAVALAAAAVPSRATAEAAAGAQNANTNANAGGQGTSAPARSSNENAAGSSEDLSGTYEGKLRLEGDREVVGSATLTITGNQFTIVADGTTLTGRITAATTRGYTGAVLYFPEVLDAATNTPLAASVRARLMGDRLRLTPAPGARNKLSFRVCDCSECPDPRSCDCCP